MASTQQTRIPCPFERCRSTFSQQRSLKTHLRNIRDGFYDESHPESHPQWKRLNDEGFFLRNSRPGNLSEEETKRRRTATQRRTYIKNKPNILRHQKNKRAKYWEYLDLTEKLANNLHSLRDPVKQHASLMKDLYSNPSSDYTLHSFLDGKTNIDFTTFPRIIVYYLPIRDLPDLINAIPGETLLFDILPGASHYRSTLHLLHHDHTTGDTKLQQLLDDSWQIWREVLETKELEREIFFEFTNEAAYLEFKSRSENHIKLAEMFHAFSDALSDATDLLTPPGLSLCDIYQAISSAQREEMLLNVAEINNESSQTGMKELLSKADEVVRSGSCKRGRRKRHHKEAMTLEDSSSTATSGSRNSYLRSDESEREVGIIHPSLISLF